MKLTAKLALSQLKVNRRRSIWTFVGILLSTAMLTTIYGLGYGTGMDWADRISYGSAFRIQYLAVISGLAAVMSAFVITISIIVISNAFRVSAAERMSQFGILKSTGATKKQIMHTVVYEGLFLTMIAVPAGIALGLLVQFISVNIINNTITPMLSADDLELGFTFDFVFSWLGLFLAIGVSLLTVFLSAYLPARKAAHTPAINAIRGVGEVHISKKKIRGGKVVQKIFGIEGHLARTFLKRSKRNFRATVIAMSFSVAIFIIAGSFYDQSTMFANAQWGQPEADVIISTSFFGARLEVDCANVVHDGTWRGWQTQDWVTGETVCFEHYDVDFGFTAADFNELSAQINDIVNDDDTVFGIGWSGGLRTSINLSDLTNDMSDVHTDMNWLSHIDETVAFGVRLVVVNDVLAEEIAQRAGVPVGSNVLINQARTWMSDGRIFEFEQLEFNYQTLSLYDWDDEIGGFADVMDLPLHGVISGSDVRDIFTHNSTATGLMVVVPEANLDNMEWLILTDDEERIAEAGVAIIDPFVDQFFLTVEQMLIDGGYEFLSFDAGWGQSRVVRDWAEQDRQMIELVMFFIFTFVGVLILIGLTNVISTISENVKTRSKEFAVLQSVGMTGGGIGRMLNLETIFSSFKALLYGVPLGILGSYGVFTAMANVQIHRFYPPWTWLTISIIAVFIVTWVTMRFAVYKLKNQNIIETIRNGSGV